MGGCFVFAPSQMLDAVSEDPLYAMQELAAWRTDYALLTDMEDTIANVRAVIDNSEYLNKCIEKSFKDLSDQIYNGEFYIPGFEDLLDFESLTNEIKSRFDYSDLVQHLIYTGNIIDGLQEECSDKISYYKTNLANLNNDNVGAFDLSPTHIM